MMRLLTLFSLPPVRHFRCVLLNTCVDFVVFATSLLNSCVDFVVFATSTPQRRNVFREKSHVLLRSSYVRTCTGSPPYAGKFLLFDLLVRALAGPTNHARATYY